MSILLKKKKLEKKYIMAQQQPYAPQSEQYKVIRTHIEFLSKSSPMKILAVTSSGRGHGTTTAVVNIGVVMAQKGIKVLLIDGNIRNPEIHLFFGKKNLHGLTDILLDPHIKANEFVIPTSVEGLNILTAGSHKIGVDIITEELISLFNKYKQIYDLIIIDCPSIVENANAQIISSSSDASIMVIRFGKTKKEKALKAKKNLEAGGSRFIGVIGRDNKKIKKSHFF
ncbi:CpsD/CapB family tyrosine-protein kinase [Jeotgalibacillus sp. R-1-5s-1]|uniref:CpsD/CapB family tyrosine-protein kinase n=1 Tax=Jeotgalibacillus sp. R-1-5s-1 TaxID=2555897 RepID=UPI00106D78FB|nr:CpsD/CapB family tyrosine-protein kinase [Jeotgalibacillus sp. R-1-5s-1]TFE00024.1 tyrosine-protein kinase family protein [Jeotgalibacillus sp. R-1-5s-1]